MIHQKILLILSIFITLHTTTEAVELPRYWICEGNSQQSVLLNNTVIERYTGHDPVLLEIAGQKVNQFMAPALFGIFVQCTKQPGLVVFQKDNCLPSRNNSSFRRGELNPQTGVLIYTELSLFKGKEIKTQANYQCLYLGHTYNFTPFNHVKSSD